MAIGNLNGNGNEDGNSRPASCRSDQDCHYELPKRSAELLRMTRTRGILRYNFACSPLERFPLWPGR